MLRFLFRNPRQGPAGIFVASAGMASIFNDGLRFRARFSIPVVPHSLPLPLFLNKRWSSTGAALPLVNCSVASPIALDRSDKDDADLMEDNSDCIQGCLGRNAFGKAADKAGPAVVCISVVNRIHGRFFSHLTRFYVGENAQNGIIIDPDGSAVILKKRVGSGAIIDSDGTILTCAHVVVDPDKSTLLSKLMVDGVLRKCFDEIEVKLQDGREYVGTVINVDVHSDIAVIKIKSKTPLPYLRVGNSCKLRSGDWVVAVGYPIIFQSTFTVGIVSHVDRKSSDLGLKGILQTYLQTDCALSKGSSGGPLVNLSGEIVGINVKAQDEDRLSLSLPIESALRIIKHFKKYGRVVRPWLRLEMHDLNDMIIQQHKKRDSSFPDVCNGVQVPMVTRRSPGHRAGFCPGDIIVEFEGKPVKSSKEIFEILGDRVGVKIEARVMRANNKEVTLTVVPEEAKLDGVEVDRSVLL